LYSNLNIDLISKYSEDYKWINTALVVLIGFSIAQIIAFYFQGQVNKIFVPITTAFVCLSSILLYNYISKKIAFLVIVIFLCTSFTIRPWLLGPVWSVMLVYILFPIMVIVNLKVYKKYAVIIFITFSILAIVNLLGNYYTKVENGTVNIISEILFLLGSIILIQKVLISFRSETIEITEQASFTNNYLENVLSIAPIMMYTLDKNQRYKMINGAYLVGTGYSNTEDVIGKTKVEIFTDERYGNMNLSLDQDENLLNGSIEKYSGTRELVMAETKQLKWVAYNKVATKDKDGNITGILCVMNDVTEIIKKQESLDVKNEELQHYIDSNLQLESFAFLASHDLKTPLRSISGFSQLLLKTAGNKLNKEELEYINYIVSSTHNMNTLINDLLEYSTINKAEFKVNKISLENLVNAVKADLQISIIENKASVNLIETDVKSFDGDFVLLKQAFNNLISNAIKYKKPDVNPIINISCKKLNNQIQFAIADNGIGIEEEYFDKIFLILKRLHSSETHDGTGIGLAICKQIAEKHNGKIWVESELNVGSTFYFTIDQHNLT